MGKFLALITIAAMALFIASPAMAIGLWDLSASYTFDKNTTVTGNTTVDVTKDVDIDVTGDIEPTGGLEVRGDAVFKELDVQVQDEEVVNKLFGFVDAAESEWIAGGSGQVNVIEQLQNGDLNFAFVEQNPFGWGTTQMNVALQYQVGDLNLGTVSQGFIDSVPNTNNFAKQIQISPDDATLSNSALIVQD